MPDRFGGISSAEALAAADLAAQAIRRAAEPDPYAAWRDLHCDRCGSLADVTWVDVRQLRDPGPVEMPAGAVCSAGCKDAAGFTGVRPAPSPEELAAEADRAWLDRHRRLASDTA